MASKKVVTAATDDGGRSVRVTHKNIAAVAAWLGDALLVWDGGDKPKLKLKTPKGPRVATPDDVIIKYGTRRNNGSVSFRVEKAS